MTDLTIMHPLAGNTRVTDVLDSQNGCLVRIYPAEGACGMWDLQTDEVFLGRDYDCDIYLEDDAASRRHAAIQRDERGFLLIDLNSTNGTFVNKVQVKQHRLVAGDRIRIGSHLLKYLSADHIELQYYETVFKMTTRDGLTQAHNRQYMNEFLERELSLSKERSREVTVAMMDIDFFKQVNDTHGHMAGDEVLREFCERASDCLRSGDLLARYGGEEFCVVFCECGQEEGREVAEKIRERIAAIPFVTRVGEIPVTVSVGLATYESSDVVEPNQILNLADEKLYEAKEGGRNRVCSTTC